jgi:hypothetical protein
MDDALQINGLTVGRFGASSDRSDRRKRCDVLDAALLELLAGPFASVAISMDRVDAIAFG